jgi:mono/diheme cytochrome c family protein
MRLSRILATGLVAVLLLAACSKGSNSSSSTSSSAPEGSSAAENSMAPMGSASPMEASSPMESPSAMESGGAMTAAAGGASAAAGKTVYATNCASCHQASGQGLPGTFPPLAGSQIVTGDPTHVIHIVKYGLTGPVQVGGNTFNGQMPAWSPQLSNDAIASVVTYMRTSWGNTASPVTASQVQDVTQ